MELSLGENVDKEVVFIASLLHDCAKYKTPTEEQKKEWEAAQKRRELRKARRQP